MMQAMSTSKSLDASCNQCGASLQVDEATRFVTCPSCKTRLAVHVSGATVLTEVIEKGAMPASADAPEASKTAQMAEKFQSSVKDFVSNPGTGRPRPPSAIAGVLSIVLGAAVGGAMIGLVQHGAPKLFLAFGLFFFGAGLYNGLRAISLSMKRRK